ncbi:unnamed protein product [Aspergillus oryzae var. brunneus]|uniref:Unnamed protein product n=2 Tax=Aspergillus oryzae TaxID=5062 RepID=A0AAN4YR12_ASPOZ|nr:unnamed protein product [Aspergillus oryzae]GMG53190.1 unnamed protein product [Aspergillus oryzae var. brunneus]
MRQELKAWGRDVKSRLRHRPKTPQPSKTGIHADPTSLPSAAPAITQHSINQAQDLWQSAFDQLDRKEQQILSTLKYVPIQEGNGGEQNGNSPTEAIIEKVIQGTKQQYEGYQNGGIKIRRSTGEDIDLRKLSRNIIDAALSFKDIVSAVVAFDPSCYAASAWTVVSLGLTVSYREVQITGQQT